jgi:hypothetical protein
MGSLGAAIAGGSLAKQQAADPLAARHAVIAGAGYDGLAGQPLILAVGIVATWLLAVPAVNVSLYTTASLGGYGEALLIGNLLLIVALRIARHLGQRRAAPAWLWAAWGFLAGLGLWAFGLTLVYSIPAGFFIAWRLAGSWKSS